MKITTNVDQKVLWIKRVITLIIGVSIWNLPIPWDLSADSWHLFAIFFTAIIGVLIEAMSIFTASIIALVAVVLLRVLTPEKAFSGFSESFILLILAAFLVAKGVIKSGLGRRIAFLLIRRFGKSTLNLGYCIVATDTILGPAIPSNTARSGILYPITHALSLDTGSTPTPEGRKKTGTYLMMTAISGHTISSALWFTGMAANPVGAGIAAQFGVEMNFGNWVFVASVPCIIALLIIPIILYKLFPPESKYTPEAPEMARKALQKMGPMSRQEWIMGITFFGMVLLWAFSPVLNINLAIVAFLGLSVLILANVYTLKDIRQGAGDALETYVWFAILYMMSTALNDMGFMKTLGAQICYLYKRLQLGYGIPPPYGTICGHSLSFCESDCASTGTICRFLTSSCKCRSTGCTYGFYVVFCNKLFCSRHPSGLQFQYSVCGQWLSAIKRNI